MTGIMNLTIYHNPRCSKSRKTLEIIESRGLKPRIIEYLNEPPDPQTLLRLAEMLDVPLADLLRRSEADFADSPDAVPIDDKQALSRWLHDHPRVLQRPIVVDDDKGRAVVGRPPENVLELITS
jgi:arsenate reductase